MSLAVLVWISIVDLNLSNLTKFSFHVGFTLYYKTVITILSLQSQMQNQTYF